MRRKHIMFFCTVLSACACTYSAASAASIGAEYDYINNIVTVSGKTDKADSKLAVEILKPGIAAADLYGKENPGDFISYNGEFSADETGSFSEKLKLSAVIDEGEYTIYIGSKDLVKTEVIPIHILKAETYGGKIDTLCGKTDYESFYDYFKAEKEKLGFENDDVTYNEDNVIRILYDYVQINSLDSGDSVKNKKIFNAAMTVESLKNKELMPNCIDSLYFKDSRISEAYKQYITDEKTTKYFENLLKNMQIANITELENGIRDAIILTVVKYPNGTGNIKDIFTKFNDVLNANVASAGTSAYTEISGNDYTSVAVCVAAFNSAAGSGSVGGQAGSSYSGASKKKDGGLVAAGTGSVAVPEKIDIKFEDLNSVQWAYTAISELFDKGVVSGKSETLFMPNDNVTREEFVKMLVCAFGLKDGEYENVFSDVGTSAWYEPYTSAAYHKGVCTGRGDGTFGVGANITRQDMSVMLYNALKAMGTECKSGELTFEDSAEISDYAKEAVAALAASEIVNGTGDNMFTPNGLATRAQAAVIICNAMNYSNR